MANCIISKCRMQDCVVQGEQRDPSKICEVLIFVKLRRGSGKDWQGMALKVKGLKA